MHFEKIIGSQIQKIEQPSAHFFTFETYSSPQRQKWLFSAHSHYPRVLETWSSFTNPKIPPLFCVWLRSRLLHATFVQIESPHPQIYQFQLKRGIDTFYLIWEGNGKHSNLLLLNENHELQMALFNPNQSGRSLSQGKTYILPSYWHKLPTPFSETDDERMIDAHYWKLEDQLVFEQQRQLYQKHLNALQKKCSKRLSKQEQDLTHCENAEMYQQWGELLKPQFAQIQYGQTEITLVNYFHQDLSSITIPLQQQLQPRENLEYYFHKANKYKKAVPHVEKRILQTMLELEQVEAQLTLLETLTSLRDFQTWQAKLPRFLILPEQSAQSLSSPSATPFMRKSSDGFLIVVGRNKEQNHKVTFSLAGGNDWWFHAQGVAGSHVIVKCSHPSLPPKTLWEAAQLAAYYSKGRPNRKLDVDYTQRKYVRKIKGGEPGQVTFSQSKSLYVEIDDSLIQQLLAQECEFTTEKA
ncbi:NFACT RNA binding domain-containing protein [Deltaproteobacteria bacterium TL4]